MPNSRRRFVQGACAGGAAWLLDRAVFAQQASAHARAATLSGVQFSLSVAQLPLNVTGRERIGTAVNGSIPGPTLRFREGDTVRLQVSNRLTEPTSIHWHGVLLPNNMDGVPGLTFRGIAPGETFAYQFALRQSGTYWYHSHSGMQEQTGLYGALIIAPRVPEPYAYEREHVVLLSDWSDAAPMSIMSNLKQQSDYYNYQQRTLMSLRDDAQRQGLRAALADRLMWGRMRMSPTDIMDVTGSTYTFLVNGRPPAANWTGLYRPGERVRLRFINAAAMTTFDVRIPGLTLRVVQADGSDVQAVEVDEIRIGVAETYDVIVTPVADAYTIFAQAQDRSGYARGTLAARYGMTAAVPPMDPRALRTMADMGMAMGVKDMTNMPGMAGMASDMASMPGMAAMGPGMANMPGMAAMTAETAGISVTNADGVATKTLVGNPEVDNVAASVHSRLAQAGSGLGESQRRVLTYADLKSVGVTRAGTPAREIEFHLTGNMQRWVWGFDGKKFSESEPVRLKLGECVRFVLINDTMMEHPIHLHGFLTVLENGQGDRQPLKHTVNVKPAERLSYLFTPDAPGRWAFHCHLLYHMEAGMFRTVLVA